MTIREAKMLTDHWRKHPPACELLEILVQDRGIEIAPRADVRGAPIGDLDAFASEVEAAMGGGT